MSTPSQYVLNAIPGSSTVVAYHSGHVLTRPNDVEGRRVSLGAHNVGSHLPEAIRLFSDSSPPLEVSTCYSVISGYLLVCRGGVGHNAGD